MSNQKGFSLLAVALILIVIGALIIAQLLPQSATKDEKVRETQRKLDAIKVAIGTYASKHGGVYPCPARFDRNISSTTAPLFGVSVDTCVSTNFCAQNGIYCTDSQHQWIGTVPVRTIGLADDYAFDGWGNRFTYAADNLNPIPIFNTNSTSTLIAKTNFHVVSHGPNGKGAYLRNNPNPTLWTAGVASSCPTSTASPGEYGNCWHNFGFVYKKWGAADPNYDDISLTY